MYSSPSSRFRSACSSAPRPTAPPMLGSADSPRHSRRPDQCRDLHLSRGSGRLGSSQDCIVAELQVSQVSQRVATIRGLVRIYSSELCPRQDSNLRSRLRRPLLCTALTWPSVLNETHWGAYGAQNAGLKGDATLAQ